MTGPVSSYTLSKGVVLSHTSHLWVVETCLKAPSLSGQRELIDAPPYHMNAPMVVSMSGLVARSCIRA